MLGKVLRSDIKSLLTQLVTSPAQYVPKKKALDGLFSGTYLCTLWDDVRTFYGNEKTTEQKVVFP